MCQPQIDEDTQEINRRDVLRILKRRQQSHGHTLYGAIAFTLTLCAGVVGGTIIRDARADPEAALTLSYAAFLTFAGVLGFAASASTFTWLLVRNERKLAAENDMISEYRQRKQVKEIRQQFKAALEEHTREERVRQFNNRFGNMFAAEGTTGSPPPAPGQGAGDDRTQVLPFERPRRSSS